MTPSRVDCGRTGAFAALAGEFPRARTALILALIPAAGITRVFHFGPKNVNLALSEVVLPFGMLLLAARLLRGRIRLPIAGVFLFAMLAIAVSSMVNLRSSLAGQGTVGMVVELGKFVLLWLHFYLTVNLLESGRDFVLLLRIWMIASGCVAASGILGSILYQSFGVTTGFSLMFRAQGTMGDANLFAAHLTLSFILTLLYRRVAGVSMARVLPFLLLHVTGILFSASRGQLLAFALSAGCLWIGICTWRQRTATVAVAAAALAVALAVPMTRSMLLSNPIVQRLRTTTVSLQNDEVSDRHALWMDALRSFASSPLVGIGRGNTGSLEAIDPRASQVHNSHLGLLCELGLLGFSAYVLLVGFLVWRMVSRLLLAGAEWRQPAVIALAGLAGVGLSGMTISIENYRGLWILLGVLEAMPRLAESQAATAAQRVSDRGAGGPQPDPAWA